MTVPSQIYGWSPLLNTDPYTYSFESAGFKSPGPSSPRSQTASPSSSTSSLVDSQPTPFTSAAGTANDPNHVRRPRNAFIIFRCDFSREHAGVDQGDSVADRSLSKRAAIAWRGLSEEQKQVYKERAAQEKGEHARANPNYRYRPVKKPQPASSEKRAYAHKGHRTSNSLPRSIFQPSVPGPCQGTGMLPSPKADSFVPARHVAPLPNRLTSSVKKKSLPMVDIDSLKTLRRSYSTSHIALSSKEVPHADVPIWNDMQREGWPAFSGQDIIDIPNQSVRHCSSAHHSQSF
jgi:hypothetical protein